MTCRTPTRKLGTLRITIALIMMSAVCISCISVQPIYYKDDKAVAIKHVDRFHEHLNADRFEKAYEMFSPRLKTEITREAFIERGKKFKAEFGNVSGRRELKSEVVPVSNAREVRFLFETQFEKKSVNEGFAILVDGENAVIDAFML